MNTADCFDSFDLQVTRIEGLLTIELHTVVRPSARVLVAFKVSVGGPIGRARTISSRLTSSRGAYLLKADIVIRRDLTTSLTVLRMTKIRYPAGKLMHKIIGSRDTVPLGWNFLLNHK